MEIPGGRGEQPEALWNGKSGGVGAQTVNNPPWGGYGYFLELHNGKKSGFFFKASASAFPVVKSNSFHVLEKSLKKC